MRSYLFLFTSLAFFALVLWSCTKEQVPAAPVSSDNTAVRLTFGDNINLSQLANYANQSVPLYIGKDNTRGNIITDARATLGRVLFYDKKLSVNNQISCASCHQQQFAFGDNKPASTGVNGTTGRHSMRLVNARFGAEVKFFWDERAATLEAQTTRPIQDHAEMGYSGQNGDPGLSVMLAKLEQEKYYQELFGFVYNDTKVTEARLQECLAQFIRSIQSFDSKYDAGRNTVAGDNQPFPNFTQQENLGRNLFLAPPQLGPNGVRIGGGAGCQGCHRAPEFDIDPGSRNNGITGSFAGTPDLTVTRSPSLRDVVRTDGTSNGPLMHNGIFGQLINVVNHYNRIPAQPNNNLDPRLRPGGMPQNLQLTENEKEALVAFMRTLSGSNVYTDKKWSDPFIR